MNAQDQRRGKFLTDLKSELSLARFTGTDRMNGLFRYEVTAISESATLDFSKLLGTHGTVVIDVDGQQDAYFDGIITSANWIGEQDAGIVYSFVLEPFLKVASLRKWNRIFHEMKPQDIVMKVINEDYATFGSPLVESALRGTYPELEYTVQFNETDLNFILRMLQRFGISHYFEHADGNHKLILVDDVAALTPRPNSTTVELSPQSANLHTDAEHFRVLSQTGGMTTGGVRLMDYNFKDPTAGMEVESSSRFTHVGGDIESFEYPGDYLERTDGKDVVSKRRAEEAAAAANGYRASGPVPSLKSGDTVTIKAMGKDNPQDGKELYCIAATHSYSNGAYATGGDQSDQFDASFEMRPKDAPLVAARSVPDQKIYGPLPAKVVGSGEIDVDDYGRILVHFPWDLDEAHSMRCRVVQTWAGPNWGSVVLPRIGMEVLVEFVNGDPNFPIVTGCVYNGANMPPYDLPGDKTRMTIMSKTHEGEGFNELRFEDANGKEEVFIHAQKDMNIKVEDNATERVNDNKIESVGQNRASETHNNQKEVIGGDFTILVGPGKRGTVTPSSAEDNTQGIGQLGEQLDSESEGSGILAITTEAHRQTNIGTFDSLKVNDYLMQDVTNHTTLSTGKKFLIDAGDEITLKCGKAQITMKKDGTITVSGKEIKTTSTGNTIMQGRTIKLN